MKSIDELPERIRAKIRVNEETGCWDWIGHLSGTGYGRIVVGRKVNVAHRLVYESIVGPIPNGLQCDHLCRNRRCCNPAHIEPVTQKENILRGVSPTAIWARTEKCPKCGGELTAWRKIRSCAGCRRRWAADRFRERYATDPNFREHHKERSRKYRMRKRSQSDD